MKTLIIKKFPELICFSSFLIIFLLFVHNSRGQSCINPSNLQNSSIEICIGSSIEFCRKVDDYHYKWLPESAFLNVKDTYSTNPTTIKLNEDTTISLVKSDNDGNVISVQEIEISIINISIQVEEIQSMCPKEIARIEAIPSGGRNYAYLWSTGETTANIEVSPKKSTIYSIKIQDTDSGCVGTATSQVTILRTPTISIISTDSSICEIPMSETINHPYNQRNTNNDCNNSAILYAGTGLSGYSYLWSNGETEPLINAFKSEIYSVTVTKDGGCSSTTSYELNSCIEVEIFPENIQDGNKERAILNAGGGFVSYEWRKASKNEIISTNQILKINGFGKYTVTVVNNEGCIAKDSFIVAGY